MVKKPGGAAAQASSKAAKNASADPASAGRLKQIGMVAGIIRKSDPKALPIVIGSGVAVLAVVAVVGLLTGLAALLIPLGVLLGLMTSMLLFGRYAQSAQYAAIAGQPGAAAAIVQTMRGNWTVTPAIAGNRNMDIVHRVVGRPGVVLIGEGSPNGLASLLSAEKKKIARIAYAVPITELQVGDDKGQIPVRQLQRTLMKMPRTLKPAAVSDLNSRLKALPSSLQAPRGPMPRTGRMPKPPAPEGALASTARRCARPAQPEGALGQRRTTAVFAARSCSPRRSRSVSSGGMTHSRSSVRTMAQPGPIMPPSRLTTLIRSSSLPSVSPVSQLKTKSWAAKRARVQYSTWTWDGLISATTMNVQASQSMKIAPIRRAMPAIAPRPASGNPTPAPG